MVLLKIKALVCSNNHVKDGFEAVGKDLCDGCINHIA
jgi:hypothetical protein